MTKTCGINPGLIAAAAFLAAAIFLVDLLLSLGAAEEVLWVALVFLGWWFSKRSYITPLMMLEYRAVPLVAIWATAVFLFIAKRAEGALRASERLMRDAVESVSDGFALYGAEDRLVLFNTRCGEGLPEIFHRLKNGVRFEEVIRALAERGLPPDSTGRAAGALPTEVMNARRGTVGGLGFRRLVPAAFNRAGH